MNHTTPTSDDQVFARLDELTAMLNRIQAEFDQLPPANRGGAHSRQELDREHTRVMNQRGVEIGRLLKHGISRDAIRARLDATDNNRRHAPNDTRQQ